MSSTVLVNLVLNELKLTPLGSKAFDLSAITQKVNTVIAKLDPATITLIQSYLTNDQSLISICVSDLQNILHHGKVDINVSPYFLDIIKNIYAQVKDMSGSSSISSETLIDVCEVILNIILIFVVVDEVELSAMLQLTTTSVSLIKFSMIPQSFTFPCCCK
jgi:hypothetical protein